jgi:hypothetical protein
MHFGARQDLSGKALQSLLDGHAHTFWHSLMNCDESTQTEIGLHSPLSREVSSLQVWRYARS